MNSSTPGITAPSRPYSVRIARWWARLVWNHRTGLALVCLISLLTLYYQWENWRSARELKAAHQRLVERLGTDDMLAFASPTIPDEQNYFVLPVITQWATGELSKGSPFRRYVVPQDAFWPKNLRKPPIIGNEADGTSWLDWTTWLANRNLKGETPAVALNRELGEANGLLTQLAAGLGRPFACFKPSFREAVETAGENRSDTDIPDIRRINDNQQDLCLHLRCAAAAGDEVKARQVALISLRLFAESAAAHGTLVISLQSLACHGIAFKALQDALGHAVWDEASLHALQMQLTKINDLRMMEHAMCANTLWSFAIGIGIRNKRDMDLFNQVYVYNAGHRTSSLSNGVFNGAYAYGPAGWHDANLAFFIDGQLDAIGPEGETNLMSVDGRYASFRERLKNEFPGNPRRMLAAMISPQIGSVFTFAAKSLFHRRCLIIACALERHRMVHGSFPTTLEVVEDELKLFAVNDPARPAQRPGYRLETNGYLLWSAGENLQDDGGQEEKDWLWRMKLASKL